MDKWFFCSFLLAVSATSISNDLQKERIAPSVTIERQEKTAIKSKKNMVVAAHPLAAQAGMKILCKGGNALDAAIATELVLNIVEPVASGIGGGGFLLYYDNKTGKVIAFDGRETAPKYVTETQFLNNKGEPLELLEAATGGKAVAIPGLLRMFELAHKEYGKLPWKELFQPAIEIAENGFTISNTFHEQVSSYPRLKHFEESFNYFFQSDGSPISVGTTLKNPAFAQTLKDIANNGVNDFYSGNLAKAIVDAVNKAPTQPAPLTIDDLASYQAIRREPITSNYRDCLVYSFPPPSSGGIALLQILGILQNLDLNKTKAQSTELIHLFAEASALAFADRAKYVADPSFVSVPVQQLLNTEYLKKRAALIRWDTTLKEKLPGNFETTPVAFCPDCNRFEPPSTSQVSIVDQEGNAVSMTCTIEHSFGSGIMVKGFLLNNQMTDFSFTPEVDGVKTANRIEPGKRPRSSMCPSFVFDNATKKLKLVIGSPGGARIIDYVARPILNVIEFKQDVQTAISSGNFVDLGGALELEKDTEVAALKPSLEKLGHQVEIVDLNSGVHAIEVKSDELIGGSDPRREGAVSTDSACYTNR